MERSIEWQTCSLELAKRLKELGVEQESYFWYDTEGLLYHPLDPQSNMYCVYRAFTVSELGEMLPAKIENGYLSCDKCSSGEDCQGDGTWVCCYGEVQEGKDHNCFEAISGNTLAEAMAKMLIYLIENKLIEVK